MNDVNAVNFDETLPFIREILNRLTTEAENANTSLIGFVGAPFTLAAHEIEGKSSKNYLITKKMIIADLCENNESKVMSRFVDILAQLIGDYAHHQIECGAQFTQSFESWSCRLFGCLVNYEHAHKVTCSF